MAVRIFDSSINVLDAAKIRIKNVFDTGKRIYLAFSAGKDSLCLSHLVYSMILNGDISPELLTVFFVDEEGIYPSMVKNAERWRHNFMKIGVPFIWFCLPFKQVSVIDSLSAQESWITWEPGKEDVWMRMPPPYAVMSSPYLHYAGEMNYQTFAERAFSDGIRLIGVRTAESYTRLRAVMYREKQDIAYPIYDWKNADVWRYIRDNNLEFPDIYMRMYEAGTSIGSLRLCAFFGDGSTAGLQHVAETEPELWERIQRREPNAYLALLYWDSEMFNKNTSRRKELEEGSETKDYKKIVEDILFGDVEKYRITGDTKKQIPGWRTFYTRVEPYISQATCKKIYEGLIYGDPKARMRRNVACQAAQDRNKACGISGVDTRGKGKV